jgi:hypothetical protein
MPKTSQSHRVNADITPSATRLLSSLRDVGYDFATAVADIVDNSIAASARRIDVRITHDDDTPKVIVADDGAGMTEGVLIEALRLGSRREYEADDLGKFGMGLKTASLSQCRRLVVVSRHSQQRYRVASAILDLDSLATADRWRLSRAPDRDVHGVAGEWLHGSTGTVVIWEKLDRVLPAEGRPTGWDRRRLLNLVESTAFHLSMVFHRFLEGTKRRQRVRMTVNGRHLKPWNPFAPSEKHSRAMGSQEYEIGTGVVRLQGHVLPARDQFSSPAAFESLSGPRKWNRQQGFYIYRNDRLIQSGGWCGLRAPDEHTKLARISLDFPSLLDPLFNVNIAKMRVSLPGDIRPLAERAVLDIVKAAQSAYRGELRVIHPPGRRKQPAPAPPPSPMFMELMVALRAAALVAGESKALGRILARLRKDAPSVAIPLGLATRGRGVRKARADA